MRRLLLAALLLLLLCAPCALAGDAYAPGCLMQPPGEVRSHIASRWGAYQLEDYCEIDGGGRGYYGFALLHKGAERLLIGYRREEGGMVYWLKNAGAVPQGEPEARFRVYTGEEGPCLSVVRLDDAAQNHEQSVQYTLREEGFRLTGYSSGTVNRVVIHDGFLEFWDDSRSCIMGLVTGSVQTELRYVSYGALPKTASEGRAELSAAPDVQTAVLTAREVAFPGGGKYDVYTGPGSSYARSGNGKGMVSTNGWIQVFGEYDGYLMIQYGISADRNRIGWIEASALPKGEEAAALPFDELRGGDRQAVIHDCALTDDPFLSREAVVQLKAGMALTELVHDADGWSYVRVTVDGRTYCGFVPTGCISRG